MLEAAWLSSISGMFPAISLRLPLDCRQYMGSPLHMVVFRPQRLGQLVSHRRGANIQAFCHLSP
jgi:hypothetical protein